MGNPIPYQSESVIVHKYAQIIFSTACWLLSQMPAHISYEYHIPMVLPIPLLEH